MGLFETYWSIRNYQDYQTAPYQLQKHEAVEVLAALQRQVPQKVILEADGEKTASGICPSCERELVLLKTQNPRYVTYCPDCGQKIDWRGAVE